MKNYIKQKNLKQNNYHHNGIEIFIVDPVPNNIDVRRVLEKISALVPNNLLKFIKKIKIGQFEILDKRELNALYKDNTVYLTNLQESEFDMLLGEGGV